MKPIQTDSFSADALVPNAGPGKGVAARNTGKTNGFRSLLTQFGSSQGKHLPAMPRHESNEKMATSARLEAAENAAPKEAADLASGEKPDELGKVLSSETGEALALAPVPVPVPLADPAAPVLWAQMQMGQAVVHPQSNTESEQLLNAPGAVEAMRLQTPTLTPKATATAPSLQDQVVMPATEPSLVPSGGTEVPSFLKAAHHQNHVQGGAQGVSWITELRNLATTASAQKAANEQAKLSADPQMLKSPAPELAVAAIQTLSLEGLRADQKLTSMSSKGGFESGQTLYSSQGLDMTTQANQSAANLGISATIPIDAPPETAVANQVAVWVSQNVQSAELKLELQGGDPVEVSISMAGNQATVEFRCDQPETREILNRAADQLHAMLQNEGLILSGVSVGASGQGSSGRKNSPSDQAGSAKPFRTSAGATGEQLAGPSLNSIPRVRVAAGAVDLFV